MALPEQDDSESQHLIRAMIVLIRNTTWRCGKLERLIVRNLHKRKVSFGRPEMAVRDMIMNFSLSGKRRNEFLDAIKRLERRNIVRILTVQAQRGC